MDDSVIVDDLIQLLDGYSGADIESLIGRVKNLALLRNCEVDELSIKPKKESIVLSQITMKDFVETLHQFQPTFSRYNETIQQYVQNYPDYSPDLEIKAQDVIENMFDEMKKPYVVSFPNDERSKIP